MKQNLLKSLLLALLLAMLPRVASAYDFMVDGLCYNYNSDGTSVTVTYEGTGSFGYGYSNLNGDLVIPESVTSNGTTYSVTTIDSDAFYDCTGLTSVTIPNSVTTIGSIAFYGCTGLTSVTIPNSVTAIGSGAFYNTAWFNNQPDGLVYAGMMAYKYKGAMPNGTSIVLKDGCTGIAGDAFCGRAGLTEVTIPNSVKTIGGSAFEGCIGLTSVTIGNSVTSIGGCAFRGCTGLTSVTIPNSVTTIGEGAFYNCTGLTEVTIPNSVTTIDEAAFKDCTGLTEVTIGNSVTTIGRSAFKGCTGLISLTLGNSVTTIGNEAFSGCTGLTSVTIPNSVTTIGNEAFSGCTGLTSVTIPNSVTSIGSGAFSGCTGLTSVTIPNSVTSIGSGAFSGCTGLTEVTIPNSVTTIGIRAFGGCSGLTEVTIPNSVTTIGDYAFSSCTSLTEVTIPNSVTTIGDYAFSSCTGLTEVTIGNSVTTIGRYAFSECTCLTSVTIPNSVTTIGSDAFSGCTGLTSVTIGNSVTTIGYRAFSGCTGLTSVTIPNSVTMIDVEAFSGCTGLTSVTIPNSVTTIGSSAFEGTPWFNNQPDGLVYAGMVAYKYKGTMPNGTSIVLKDGCTGIAGDAFQGCTGLTSVTIPNSVTAIGYNAFYGCTGLIEIVVENGNPKYDSRDDCNAVIETESNTLIVGCKSTTIPNSVTTIGSRAFYDCTGLTSLTIPGSVTTIGNYAFSGCTGLTTLEIPSTVTAVGNYSFQQCTGLTQVTWNVRNGYNYSNYRYSPFYNLSSINSFIFGNEVKVIPRNLCAGLSGMVSIIIPNTVESIDGLAFNGATSNSYALSTITLTGKGEWNVQGLSGLRSKFKTINIGSEITSLGDLGFTPETINCYAALPPACQQGTFTNTEATLHVPTSSTAAYFVDEYWQNFNNIINDLTQKVVMNQNDASLVQGATLALSATTIPSGEKLVWNTSNPDVAIVSANGVVTAIGPGECDIFASIESNRAAYASCHITPSYSNVEISLDKETARIAPNEILMLYPSCDPDIEVDLVVESSNPSVAVARIINRTNAPAEGMSPALAGEKAIMVVGVANGNATITVSSADGLAQAAQCVVTVASGIPGDVNGDGECTGSDVTALYNFILYNDSSAIVNGDQNGDGDVTGSDVTAVYNIILGLNISPSPRIVNSNDALSASDFAIARGGSHIVELALDNSNEYVAFQFDISMPQGLKIKSLSLGDRAQGGNLDYNEIRPGVYRVLSVSPTCDVIENFAGTLLYIEVECSDEFKGNGSMSIDNVMFIERDCTTNLVDGIKVGANVVSSIDDIYSNAEQAPVNVYSVNGQLLKENINAANATQGLPQGIYIIGNKKVVVK